MEIIFVTNFSVDSSKETLVDILKKKMHEGIAEFEFRKKDGSIRHAFGTTLPALVQIKTIGGEGPSGVIPFFDVEIAEWRSLRPENLISVK